MECPSCNTTSYKVPRTPLQFSVRVNHFSKTYPGLPVSPAIPLSVTCVNLLFVTSSGYWFHVQSLSHSVQIYKPRCQRPVICLHNGWFFLRKHDLFLFLYIRIEMDRYKHIYMSKYMYIHWEYPWFVHQNILISLTISTLFTQNKGSLLSKGDFSLPQSWQTYSTSWYI